MTAGIEFDPAEREAIAAEVNLSVLQRSDPSINAVLISASHVCLYELDHTHQWRRIDIEGSLFIVERDLNAHTNPDRYMHRIVVTNRKSLENYTDDIIVGNKEIELNDQMIMYTNSKGVTVGIWFYQRDDAANVFQLLKKIFEGEKILPSPASARQKRTQKRAPKSTKPVPVTKPAAEPKRENRPAKRQPGSNPPPDNSLERFFPDLMLSGGVAGEAVPEHVREASILESEAVDSMAPPSRSDEKAPTAFEPTAEIDGAIIVASETGIPDGVLPNSALQPPDRRGSTDVGSAKVKPMVKGKNDPKRKSAVKGKQAPKPSPPPKANTSNRFDAGARATSSKLNTNAVAKRASPPAVVTNGRSGSASRLSPASRMTTAPAVVPSARRSPIKKRTSPRQVPQRTTSSTEAKPAVGAKPGFSSRPAQREGTPPQELPTGAQNRSISASRPSEKPKPLPQLSPHSAPAANPDVPVSRETPGAPRNFQSRGNETSRDAGAHAQPSAPLATNGMAGSGVPPNEAARAVEDAQRRLQNLTMRQAENMKMQEAHFRQMQPYRYGTGAELGLAQPGALMGAGMGPPGAPAAYANVHSQMALMMQQQHQMYMQQQYLVQRQIQMQSMSQQSQAQRAMGQEQHVGRESEGRGEADERNQREEVQKQESAKDLLRMLQADGAASAITADTQQVTEVNNGVARDIGKSMASAERRGDLGNGEESKLDKASFRAVVQRMLTDRRLFDCVYDHYGSLTEKEL